METDDRDEALRKQVLILSTATITALAVIWVITYSSLGLYLAASIPFVYQIFTVVNLVILARTHRYRFFRACALALNLLLSFLLQLSLGGFVHSSGVILWAFTAPLGAMLFSTRRSAIGWFGGFVAILVAAGALDPFVGNAGSAIPTGIVLLFFVLNVIGVAVTVFLLVDYFVRERAKMTTILEEERARSDRLLLNVLPEPIAERLKAGESVIADRISQAGVLFAGDEGSHPRLTPMDRTEHWDRIYERRSPRVVSWYEPRPATSIRRVCEAVAGGARSLLDVGGGASALIDEVLDLGLQRIAVLDISERALQASKERLGTRAEHVEWLVGDVTTIDDVGMFDIWHDRAVLHFLTDAFDQERYVSLCERTVAPGGIAIVATFASDGPEMCSGLPVQRYDASGLAERCGPRFELLDSERHLHLTPRGVEQRFIYASFRRVSEDRAAVPV